MRLISSIALAAIAASGIAMSPQSFFVDQAAATVDAAVFEPEGANHDCLQLTGPDSYSAAGLAGGPNINLHVRLVLDVAEGRSLDATPNPSSTSVNERQAAINAFGKKIVRDHLDAGVQSYAEVDIKLDYASFDLLQTADLRTGTRAAKLEGQAAINTAKDQYGGKRPNGTDIVYVLSDRDLTNNGDSSLAGLADCIGGVTYPSRAFATGELQPNAEFSLGVPFYREYTAKVAAHEVGHLMGAHHHYQACGHYAATNYADGNGAGACTLMTNFVDFVTFPFSPTNQVVVRGHAEKYAHELNLDETGSNPDAGDPDHADHADH